MDTDRIRRPWDTRDPEPAITLLRTLTPTAIRQQKEFDAAVDTEAEVEAEFLAAAIALVKPALDFLGGTMPDGRTGLKLLDGYWLGADGQLYGLDVGRFVPVTPQDVVKTRGGLNLALTAIVITLEKAIGGNLSKRTEQAKIRADKLRALLPLLLP